MPKSFGRFPPLWKLVSCDEETRPEQLWGLLLGCLRAGQAGGPRGRGVHVLPQERGWLEGLLTPLFRSVQACHPLSPRFHCTCTQASLHLK